MDLFADPAKRDAVSPFLQFLWERGAAHEQQVVAGLKDSFVDLSGYAGAEKENGGRYNYYDVPEPVFEQMRSASSREQFLAQNIKGAYRYARV